MTTALIAIFAVSPALAQALNDGLIYDERGNISQRHVNGRITSHRYDGMDRLREEATPAGTQRFELDSDGNRLADGRSTYVVQPGAQRLATRDGIALAHGPAGHLLADRTWRNGRWVQRNFDWTMAGQLKSVHLNGAPAASYLYNDAGQRTRKTLAAAPAGVPAVTLYRHDPNGQLVMEVAGTAAQAGGVAVTPGQVLVRYIWQDAVPVAVIWPPMTPDNPGSTTDRMVYLHTDHLNTPRSATDAQGVVVWQWLSDAFGASPPDEDVDRDGRLTTINLRFPGQYFDAESGLHYNWHRYYDPQVGRYTQADPIGLGGGVNAYAYAEGRPTALTDPLGLATYMCRSPLHALTSTLGEARATWLMLNVPMAHHRYLCVPGQCGGQDQRGQRWWDPIGSKGKPTTNQFVAERCEQKESDNTCIEDCVRSRLNGARPWYGIPHGTDCQEWADEVLNSCRYECSSEIPDDRPFIGYPSAGKRGRR